MARRKRPARVSYGVDLAPPEMTLGVPGFTVVRGCGMKFLEDFEWSGAEFVYCDPPYLLSTRKSGKRYRYEMSDGDHARLLRIVKRLRVPVLLSGYPSALYDRELAGWNREEFRVMTRGHTWATEVLWFNYQRPDVAHDLAYVGDDYRARLRIKRKVARWTGKLAKLPPLERAAIFASLAEVMGAGAAAIVRTDAGPGYVLEQRRNRR